MPLPKSPIFIPVSTISFEVVSIANVSISSTSCVFDVELDGIFDVDDNCLLVANPDQLDSNNDGIGDACSGDTDEDGIIEELDNCIFVKIL